MGRLIGYFYIGIQFKLLEFYKDKKIVDLIRTIKKELNFAFYPYEAYHLYSIVKAQSNLEGEMAEVGVYQGGSSKIICETKGDRKLHLFDTFQVFPNHNQAFTFYLIILTFLYTMTQKDPLLLIILGSFCVKI